VEESAQTQIPVYDPECYLCPGNSRAGGKKTDVYTTTYVFENDFAALKPDVPEFYENERMAGLIVSASETGVCRVICFSPRHDLTLAKMSVEDIRSVVDVWAAQYRELGGCEEIQYVQVFENRGAMMGASNPHPHGQIWATQSIPNETQSEIAGQKRYLAEHGEVLLTSYLRLEEELGERIVATNDGFVALVPFWAVWPFETMILPRRRVEHLEEFSDSERSQLAAILHTLTSAYDRVFNIPFPYSMGLHAAPYDSQPHPELQFHIHFYPPLLRSATIRKFMVGFELLGGPQRDITPESAADTLRRVRSV
jgi:UDPglucose--hexose-1-phosphate uridylyltransferase